MNRAALQVNGVSKRFRKGTNHDRLGELLASGVRRLLGRRTDGRTAADSFLALDDVSFSVSSGEAVGVIGPNGAGKSTLLKLVAGILRADVGSVVTRGRVTALIEISAGFHGDLTGRENVYMNASILGMRKAEIDRKLDAIIEFSGVGEFIDTPVKRYSSGMQARLGFSVAAHVDADVLLIDEVLSVGDVLFRERCVDRMRELVAQGALVLFVTHHLEQMQSFCSRAVVLHDGRVAFDGDTNTAVAHYLSALRDGGIRGEVDEYPERVTGLAIRSPSGAELSVVRADAPLEVEVRYHLSKPYRRLAVEVDVRRELGSCLANFSSIRDGVTFDQPEGDCTTVLTLPALPLGGGQYLWQAMLRDADSGRLVASTGYRFSTFVEDDGRPTGILCLPHEWTQPSRETAISLDTLIGCAH